MRIKLALSVILGLVLTLSAQQPSWAMYGDVYTSSDSVDLRYCPGKAYAGSKAFVQTRIGSDGWTNRFPQRVSKSGCVATFVFPADLVPSTVGQVSVRLAAPTQKFTGKTLRGWRESETAYRVWPDPTSSRDPVPHLDAFAAKYSDSVVTIICNSPYGDGGGQGTGVRIPITPSAASTAAGYGDVGIATAGHVVDDCTYRNYREVTILYHGGSYRGYVWNSNLNPDVALVYTNAPAKEAAMALEARPQIGDAAIAIGAASGVVSTTTQGQTVGVSDTELNTTVPSGHGASGGPVFDNEGRLIGLVVAGNGSLTVATALPAFCNNVYGAAWCSSPIWP